VPGDRRGEPRGALARPGLSPAPRPGSTAAGWAGLLPKPRWSASLPSGAAAWRPAPQRFRAPRAGSGAAAGTRHVHRTALGTRLRRALSPAARWAHRALRLPGPAGAGAARDPHPVVTGRSPGAPLRCRASDAEIRSGHQFAGQSLQGATPWPVAAGSILEPTP